jgi:hypothetical protein
MIAERLKQICILSNDYSSSRAIKSSDPKGMEIVSLLRKTGAEIFELFTEEAKDGFRVGVSKGKSNIPKIFWIAFYPLGYGPSRGTTVTICFGRVGEGIVAGMMESASSPQGLKERITRSNESMLVNIDGPKPDVKYNNKYFNPVAYLIDDVDIDHLIDHLNCSILELKGLIEAKRIASEEYINSRF